jgi:phosphatidylglycerol:prolipoprotein diacylglycerol transferase
MMERTHDIPAGWGLCPDAPWLYPLAMVLAFLGAALLYRYNARGTSRSPTPHLLPIIMAAFLGGVLGAKLPVVLLNLRAGFSWEALLAGRTIAGGLVGGTLAVLLIKRKLGIRGRHGNLLAPSIALGMAIGRVGCLLSGCCFGTPTALPWGLDFGDGIARHPTQAYELIFCLIALIPLQRYRRTAPPGWLLTGYFLAYFTFRFLEEFMRPYRLIAGLTTFQWICLLGITMLLLKSAMLKAGGKDDA